MQCTFQSIQNEESEEKTLENEPSAYDAIAANKRQPPQRILPPTSSGILKPIINHMPLPSSATVARTLQNTAASRSTPSTTATATAMPAIATTNATNSNWNCDSWADGEFEPLEEDTFAGGK